MIWKYDEEYFNDWCKYHADWMRNNLPVEMVEAFENEIESLMSDSDRHGFMIYHLFHMSTLQKEDNYNYWEEATDLWSLALPLVQAFHVLCMGLASRANDDKSHYAIGLANAIILSMFTPNIEEE